MRVRRRVIAISGATLAGAAALVSACAPMVNKLIDVAFPPTPPAGVVPVASTAPITEPHNGPAPRDLPY